MTHKISLLPPETRAALERSLPQMPDMCAYEVSQRMLEIHQAQDTDSIPTAELVVRDGRKVTLEGAELDFYTFCTEHEIDGGIIDKAYTPTRLGRQYISAYDIYNMIDEMKRAMARGGIKRLESQEHKMFGQSDAV